MMSDIYINEATGKKIKLYKQHIVHVYDHEDPRDILDFRDTEKGVAEWCWENVDDDTDDYEDIKEAYEDEDWELVIKLTNCRHCEYDYEEEWVVEELKDE
jgi:predicted Zn-ribbon and HTH transcriptional regulator